MSPSPRPARRAASASPLAALGAHARSSAIALAALAGANPFAVLGLILKGAAGSKFALLETLNRATPLIFTGLAVAVAFRARLWNIGAEAQLYAGALITVLLGTGAVAAPAPLLLPAPRPHRASPPAPSSSSAPPSSRSASASTRW